MLTHIKGLVTKVVTSNLQPATSQSVVAYPVGAFVSSSGSASPLTVRAGHSIVNGDLFLVVRGTTILGLRTCNAATTATSIPYTGSGINVQAEDLVINLGADTSSATDVPNWDGSKLLVYNEPSGVSTAITNSQVTSDVTTGEYEFFYKGDGALWIVIRDSGDVIKEIIAGVSSVAGRLNLIDFGCKPDNSTDNHAEVQLVIRNCIALGIDFYGPPGDFVIGDGTTNTDAFRLLLPANLRAINSPNFKLVKKWGSTGTSTAGALLVSEVFATAAVGASTSDDNIWWQGGRLTVAAADAYDGSMIGIHSDFGMVKDVVIEEYATNAVGGFGIHLYGNYGWIDNCQVYSTITTAGGSDGIGRAAGKGGGITNCRVKSADDCFTTAIWFGSGISNVATTDMVISNCYGESAGARLVSIHTATGGAITSDIERITVKNVTGKAASSLLNINIGHTSSTGKLKNINVDSIVGVGTSANAALRVIVVEGNATGSGQFLVEDLRISNIHSPITSNAVPIQGQIRIRGVNRGSLSHCSFDASNIVAAMDEIIFVADCKKFDVLHNHILMSIAAATGTIDAIQLGVGASTQDGVCSFNTIIDLPTNGIGIEIDEASGYVVDSNVIRIASGATNPIGIRDLGGTVEGNNVVCNNNLRDWLALEASDHTSASATLTAEAITQLNKGNTVYANNIGHNPVGFESYTADTTPAQGDVPVRAAMCNMTVGTEDNSITLPYAFHGRRITIINGSTANDLQIFPAKGDSIDGAATDTSKFLLNSATVFTQVALVARSKTQWVVESGSLSAVS